MSGSSGSAGPGVLVSRHLLQDFPQGIDDEAAANGGEPREELLDQEREREALVGVDRDDRCGLGIPQNPCQLELPQAGAQRDRDGAHAPDREEREDEGGHVRGDHRDAVSRARERRDPAAQTINGFAQVGMADRMPLQGQGWPRIGSRGPDQQRVDG